MSRRRALDLLLFGLVAVLGLIVDLAGFGVGNVAAWLPDVLVGATLLGCGLAVRARGEARTGVLLGAAGVAWFCGELHPGLALLHRGPMTQIFLVGPDGRVRDRIGRAAVTAGYLASLITPLWNNLFSTVGFTAALAAAGIVRTRTARGELRRRRIAGARLLAAWGAALSLLTAVHAAVSQGDADALALVAYEVVLAAFALSVVLVVARTRGRRPAVTDLVVELGEARSGALRDTLAAALGDPTLEVGFRSAAGRYLDAEGNPVYVDAAQVDRAVTPIHMDGTVVAVLRHDPGLLVEPALTSAVALAARLLQQNAQLQAEVRAQVVELQASRLRLVRAADQARSRLEAGLHSGTQQRLARLAEHLATSPATDELRRLLAGAQEQLARTSEELDRLASGLHPRVLTEHGLAEALRSLGDRRDLPVRVDEVPQSLPADVAAAVWFVCSEAVANSVKHGRASAVTIAVGCTDAVVTILVEDDGVGGADPSAGSGLRGLTDRLEAYGGQLIIDSVPGHGTVLRATLPITAPG
jgi:signal transduction histidine kinase